MRPSSEKPAPICGPDSRVLEFGCGTGSTAILLAPQVALIQGH
jgi:cyclopropane fatty-acyl-phospholipid synthase-like methyltransferase